MEIQQDPLPHPPSLPPPPPSQLSFAYSQLKEMDNSKHTQTTMNTKAPTCVDVDAHGHVFANQNLGQHGQQHIRKQVRRRLTNRPPEERLMNMADARKEIVNALKYHRATMKVASEHQQQLSFEHPFYSRFSPNGRFKARRRPKMYLPPSTKISHYLNDLSFSSSFPPLPPPLLLHSPPLSLLHAPPPPPPPLLLPKFYPHTITSPFGLPLPKPEPSNFTLPSQTLGFNLNLHSFNSSEPTPLLNNNTFDPSLLLDNNILDLSLFLDNNSLDPTLLLDNNILEATPVFNNNILESTPMLNNNILDVIPVPNNNILDVTHVLSNINILDGTPVLNNNNTSEPTFMLGNNGSSLCSYSTPILTFPPFLTDQEVPSIGISQSQREAVSTTMNSIESNIANQASGSMHTTMDEEGMEEIRALGQQHQMEWDDTKSPVTSVWWHDCLQQMENNADEVNNGDDSFQWIFDNELEFPVWEN